MSSSAVVCKSSASSSPSSSRQNSGCGAPAAQVFNPFAPPKAPLASSNLLHLRGKSKSHAASAIDKSTPEKFLNLMEPLDSGLSDEEYSRAFRYLIDRSTTTADNKHPTLCSYMYAVNKNQITVYHLSTYHLVDRHDVQVTLVDEVIKQLITVVRKGLNRAVEFPRATQYMMDILMQLYPAPSRCAYGLEMHVLATMKHKVGGDVTCYYYVVFGASFYSLTDAHVFVSYLGEDCERTLVGWCWWCNRPVAKADLVDEPPSDSQNIPFCKRHVLPHRMVFPQLDGADDLAPPADAKKALALWKANDV